MSQGKMKRYGIIGNPLGHSYSEAYFTELFAREGLKAEYRRYEIDRVERVKSLIEELDGMNVTYPYKESIIPYLAEIDQVAEKIGAVNMVYHGKGYNTDWIGFRNSLRGVLRGTDHRALLLGTGGVSKAIQYALREMGIDYMAVSRQVERIADSGYQRSVIGYWDVDENMMKTHQIIINCTPLGMHPYEEQLPDLPYQHLTEKHLLYDCIYNPEKTLFLQKGEVQGCRIKNGLDMLHLQADEAWQVWKESFKD